MPGANITGTDIIGAIVNEIVIPELEHLIDRMFRKGEPQDPEALKAELRARCDASIARAKAFLAQTANEDDGA